LPQGAPGEQVQALTRQYDEAMAAFRKRYEAAKTDEERQKLIELVPEADDYAPLFLQIAERQPRDPAAVDALLWIVRNTRALPGKADTPYAKARAVLIRDQVKHAKIGLFCLALRYEVMDAEALAFVRQVRERNPDKQAQAQAGYALARLLLRRGEFAAFLQKQADAKQTASFSKSYGEEAIADLKRCDPEALKKEAETLFESILKDKAQAATVIPRGTAKVTVGELADRELFAMQHLLPGKPAPEITGEDIDGKPLKLSDYRGRVVLLDFWGHW
jgi:hypothetical protein